jgi:5-methylcytosine-specific restriction endonuclease McrA
MAWRFISSAHKRRLRRQVIARDGLVCWLCQDPIASESDVTLDHVDPQANGGHHKLENLRPAHLFCNQQRGQGFFRKHDATHGNGAAGDREP